MDQANSGNFWAYNRNLQPFANKLRKKMTMAEACLWKYVLRARKMKGYGFRRQRPIINYIADFMSKDLMLVIEVDGRTHWTHQAKIKDAEKDRVLNQAGFVVLRFTDDEVRYNIADVEKRIRDWIELKEDSMKNDPPPTVIS